MLVRRLIRLPIDLYTAAVRWSEDDGMLLSASTAYYAIFSLFPVLLILTSILGFVLQFSTGAQDAQAELLSIVAENTSPKFEAYVRQLMESIQPNAAVSGPIGLLALLFGAIGIFAQVDAAFHRIWHVPLRHDRWFAPVLTVLIRRLRGLIMFLAMGLLVIASHLMQPIIATIRTIAEDYPFGGWATYASNLAFLMALNVLLLALIYHLLPQAKVRWWDALCGAAVTTLLWNLVRAGLTVAIANSNYATSYGLFGVVIIVMLWFYLASGIFFFGAEYIAVISDVPGHESDTAKDENASKASNETA